MNSSTNAEDSHRRKNEDPNALYNYNDLRELQAGDHVILEGDQDGSTYQIDQYGNAVLVEGNDGAGILEDDNFQQSGSKRTSSSNKEERKGKIKLNGPPGNVLMTGYSLTSRPILHVNSGRPVVSREDRCANYTDGDLPTSSGLPSMRPIFRICADAVLGNTSSARVHSPVNLKQELAESSVCMEEEAGSSANDTMNDTSMFMNNTLDEDTGAVGSGGNLRSVFRTQVDLLYRDWPLYWDSPVDFQEACEILCGFLSVDQSKVCSNVPQEYKKQGTFVIDLSHLKNRHDVGTDGLGPWGKPACKTRFYNVTDNNPAGRELSRCDDCRGRLIDGAVYTFKCYSKRYEHPCTTVPGSVGKFVKKIFTAIHAPEIGTAVGISIVTYEWSGEPFDFEVLPKLTRIRKLYLPPVEPPVGGWEAASFGDAERGPLPNNICGTFVDIPLYAVGAIDFNAASSIILGGVLVDQSKICRSVPQGYRDAGSFVIDIKDFESDAHLRLDNLGYWGKPAGHSRYYKVDPNSGDAVRVDSGNKLFEGVMYDIQILSKRYEHPSTGGRFVRKIYVGRGSDGTRYYPSCSHLAVITYYWKGDPIPFDAGGRQNEIHVKSFNRSIELMPSMIEQQPEPSIPKRRRIDDGLVSSSISSGYAADMSEIFKKEYENQVRLANILDRAEQFLEKMENSFPTYQNWNNTANDNGEVVISGNPEYAEEYIITTD